MATTKRTKAAAEAARRAAAREVKPETVVGRATREFNQQMAERARIQAQCAPWPPEVVPDAALTPTVRRTRVGMKMATDPERDSLEVLSFYAHEVETLQAQMDRLHADRWERVLLAREQGLPWTEIASASGVRRQTFMDRARAEGLR